MPKPLVGRAQLSTEVESYVREQILTGKFPAGARVRAENLAEDLGISPTPVREALQALRGQGFLSLEPRKGFRVLGLSDQDIDDVFLAQAFLAGQLARRAAVNLSDEQLDSLQHMHEQIDQAAARSDSETVQDLNDSFHRIINKSAGSPKLRLLLSNTLFYVPSRFFATNHQYPSSQHRANVLDALRRRDPDAAEESMSTLISHAGHLLREYLSDRQVETAS
ncbi:GntR family transcriptional regulator [Rhodococcus ruber BKS 20-38]|uniref:GntR family transcriptional regulator n=1 Tax=Rhodococcus ruber BKS 20-38 TaxID=1278076 RepID=M2X5C2_9NOCA|nr:GntR family transcriptional regulator [Rhodococcus ruber]EME56251.1 GntR family transcriptional regulator [Rhodococcus ruber BKS 20-38]